MNKHFSPKLSALVLLIVMLLNPVLGLAGSLSLAQSAGSEAAVHHIQLMDMSSVLNDNAASSESCHERSAPFLSSASALSATTALNSAQTDQHSECCEEPCQCAQSGCHSPVASIGVSDTVFSASKPYFQSYTARYLNPSLATLTPPPII